MPDRKSPNCAMLRTQTVGDKSQDLLISGFTVGHLEASAATACLRAAAGP